MKIAVVGTGYVGLVAGACLAENGNEVICVDKDESKVATLKAGRMPIYEPGLEEMVRRNTAEARLTFTTSLPQAVGESEIVFIAVGTPQGEDGSADLQHVLGVAHEIGKAITKYTVVVDKSTVPVGTAKKVQAAIAAETQIPFSVVSNPEFLKQGAAIEDFMKPDRIVVGFDDAEAGKQMRQLYAPFSRNHEKFVEMDIRSAELTKYAANAMLATRISFMNELANLSELLGADIEAVRLGIGMDPRIGPDFLYAGMGYGGSCFPKDVKALIKTASDHEQRLHLLTATEKVNEEQKNVLFNKLVRFFGGAQNLNGKTIALWGLSFKPNTDDMREAPSRILIKSLFEAGANVVAYDPVASTEARRVLVAEHGEDLCNARLRIVESAKQAVEGADVLVLVTEWKEFRAPDLPFLAENLKLKAVFDGRNIYDPDAFGAAGLVYEGIGRRSGKVQ